MKMHFALVAFGLLFLTACAQTPKPKIVKRFDSYETAKLGSYDDHDVAFNTFVTQPDVSIGKRIIDLPEKVLIDYLKLQNATYKDADLLRAELYKPLKPSAPKNYSERGLKIKRRLFFTVDPMGFHPGDRIAELTYDIGFDPEAGFQITGWSRFANEYVDTDPGSIELTQQNTFSISGSIEPPIDVLGGIEFDADSDQKLVEKPNLKRKQVKAYGWLTPPERVRKCPTDKESGAKVCLLHPIATIRQIAAPEIDLVGSSFVDLLVEYKPGARQGIKRYIFPVFDNLFSSNESPNTPSQVKYSRHTVAAPSCPPDNGVNIDLEYTALLRHVENGEDTFEEGDDKVQFFSIQRQFRNAFLAGPEEFTVEFWGIGTTLNGNRYELGWTDPADGHKKLLLFRSAEEAQSIVNWINATVPLPSRLMPPKAARGSDGLFRVYRDRSHDLTMADLDNETTLPNSRGVSSQFVATKLTTDELPSDLRPNCAN